ncbi:MAG: hypothetical protein AB1714_07420 [Acidobacteriota bacterium]
MSHREHGVARRWHLAAVALLVWSCALTWLYLAQRPAPPTLEAAGRLGFGIITIVFFLCVLTALGRPVVKLILGTEGAAAGELEVSIYGFGMGAAVVSLAVFTIANLGIMYRGVLLGALTAAALLAVMSNFAKTMRETATVIPARTLVILVPLLALAGMCALVEPGSTDALLYHLSIPATYLRQHSMAPIPNNFFSFWPMGCEMLYAIGLAVAGEIAPALINLTFALVTLVLLQRIASAPRLIGPAALFYMAPAVTINSGFPYADFGLTFFVLVAFRSLGHFFQTRRVRWAVLAGLFSSAAIACKYTGFYALAGFLVLFAVRRFPGGWRALVVFLAASAVLAGPWLARNAVYTGNPVYPYLDSIWGRHCGDTYRADRQSFELKNIEGDLHLGWKSLLLLPFYYTFAQPFLDYALGPIPVILLPLVLLVMARHRDILIFCISFAALWVLFSPQTRHLFPVLALLAVAEADALAEFAARAGPLIKPIIAAVLLLGAVSFLHLLYFYRMTWDPLPRLLGAETSEQFLARTMSDYPAIAFMKTLPPDATLLTVGEMHPFRVPRRCFPESKFDTPLIVTLSRGCRSSREVTQKVTALGVTHILYNLPEITRMSWIPGQYLDWSSPEDERAFFDFLRERCTAIFDRNGVVVYKILPTK